MRLSLFLSGGGRFFRPTPRPPFEIVVEGETESSDRAGAAAIARPFAQVEVTIDHIDVSGVSGIDLLCSWYSEKVVGVRLEGRCGCRSIGGNRHQPKTESQAGGRMIRRGE